MRHPLTLLTREVPLITVDPASTVVLLQDVHAPFTDTDGGYFALQSRSKVLSREFDEYFDELKLILPGYSLLVTEAKSIAMPIFFTCLGFNPPASPSTFQAATGWEWDLSGESGRLPDQLISEMTGPAQIYDKPAWGALSNADLFTKLEKMNTKNVVLAGTMFEFGIQVTAQQLQAAGISTIIVSDGVVSLTEASKNQTLGSIQHGLIKTRSLAEILDVFLRIGAAGEAIV